MSEGTVSHVATHTLKYEYMLPVVCSCIWQFDSLYRISHMHSDRQACANSVDPDETPQNAASHQGLHCLPFIQQILKTTAGSKLYLFKY